MDFLIKESTGTKRYLADDDPTRWVVVCADGKELVVALTFTTQPPDKFVKFRGTKQACLDYIRLKTEE